MQLKSFVTLPGTSRTPTSATAASGVRGTPYLVFVSPEGEILAVSLGIEALDVVNKTMEPLVTASKE